jgi:hypothetical protein
MHVFVHLIFHKFLSICSLYSILFSSLSPSTSLSLSLVLGDWTKVSHAFCKCSTTWSALPTPLYFILLSFCSSYTIIQNDLILYILPIQICCWISFVSYSVQLLNFLSPKFLFIFLLNFYLFWYSHFVLYIVFLISSIFCCCLSFPLTMSISKTF